MSNIAKQLEELAKAGERLLDVAIPEYGSGWHYLKDNIRAYKADNSDHLAFKVDDLHVAYFSPVQYNLELRHLDNLSGYIKRVEAETARIEKMVAEKTEEEIEANKAKRLAILQQQIDDLTKEANKRKDK